MLADDSVSHVAFPTDSESRRCCILIAKEEELDGLSQVAFATVRSTAPQFPRMEPLEGSLGSKFLAEEIFYGVCA
jgi:hypothetical protein